MLLDWKKVKTLLNDDNFYTKIEEYVFRGPKPEKVKNYAFINRLLDKINDD